MLPTWNSPPASLLSSISTRTTFEDDKLLFFDLPSARLGLSRSFHCPVRAAIISTHVEGKAQAAVLSQGSGCRRWRWHSNSLPGCQAWPCRGPSHCIFTSCAIAVRERLRIMVMDTVRASGGCSSRYLWAVCCSLNLDPSCHFPSKSESLQLHEMWTFLKNN